LRKFLNIGRHIKLREERIRIKEGIKRWNVKQRSYVKLGKIQPEILEVALKGLWQKNPALYKSVIINAYLYLEEKIN